MMVMYKSNVYDNVSVIIPAYNEEEGINSTLMELIEDEELSHVEIIVIDDGSSDKTYEILKKLDNIKVIRHKVNRGYGAAIVSGVKTSLRDIVVWYDSDGQHRPEDLKKVIDQLVCMDYDYCIGERDSNSHVDRSRILGKWILRVFVKMMTTREVTDFNSGLRAFKKKVLIKYCSLLPDRFGASTVTTLLMQERNYFGGSVPITVRERVGESSVNQFRDGFRTIALITNVVILFRPMKVFGTIGICSIVLGTLYGLYQALEYGLGVPTLAAIVIIFGMQTLLFGVSVSQISKLRKENLERQ